MRCSNESGGLHVKPPETYPHPRVISSTAYTPCALRPAHPTARGEAVCEQPLPTPQQRAHESDTRSCHVPQRAGEYPLLACSFLYC